MPERSKQGSGRVQERVERHRRRVVPPRVDPAATRNPERAIWRRNVVLSQMLRENVISKEEIKVRVLKLKDKLYKDHVRPEMDMKGLAHKYLNEVLDIIDEYRY